MKVTKFTLVLIFAFSILNSCKDRLFDNPFDPNRIEPGYEILAIIPIGGLSAIDITFSGDSLWIIDANSRILSLNYNSGHIIRELNFPASNTVNGICYNGSDLWLNIENTREIVKINIINGEIIKNLNLSEGIYHTMDYFDSLIYIFDKLSNSILQIDPATGEILNSINSPSFSTDGICFDGNHLWLLDSSTMRIYKMNTEGKVINIYQTPDKNPSGLCFSQGIIWCGDKSGKIFKLRFREN